MSKPRARNALKNLQDYQAAYAGAVELGYNDNVAPGTKLRPKRKGRAICELLLAPGCWGKPDERRLKIAYIGGFEFRNLLHFRPAETGRERK